MLVVYFICPHPLQEFAFLPSGDRYDQSDPVQRYPSPWILRSMWPELPRTLAIACVTSAGLWSRHAGGTRAIGLCADRARSLICAGVRFLVTPAFRRHEEYT